MRALPRSQPATLNDDSRGSDPLSSTLIDSTTPEILRSSGTIAMPSVIAAAGALRLTRLAAHHDLARAWCAWRRRWPPAVRFVRRRPGRRARRSRRSSTENDTGSEAPSTCRSRTSSTGSGFGSTRSGNSASSSRPIIAVTMSSSDTSVERLVEDQPAVAQHHDPVGDGADLGHLVGGVHHGDAVVTQSAHDPVEALDLAFGDRRRGLVEHHDLRAGAGGLDDLDDLPQTDRQAAHPGGRRDVDAERGQRLLRPRRSSPVRFRNGPDA